MWILYSIIASVGIMATEYIYNSPKFGGFWTSIGWLIIPILISQWALFWLFRTSPNIFLGGAMFTAMNAVLRTVDAVILGQKFTWITIVGLVTVVVGGLIIKLDN